MNTTPKPSQIVLMAGGAVAFLFSFFSFISIDAGGFGNDLTFGAWSTDANLFPLATWPALFGLVIAGVTAATVFGNVSLPEPILTFNWKQINFILSFAAILIMVGYLFVNEAKGFGYWIMFLGVIAYTVGSVMELLGIEVGGTSSGGSTTQAGGGPSTPF